jgi:2-polyprenyl-3-methyl-5-hydroxy-6-metoxy-1,4-benzoquinol methylase
LALVSLTPPTSELPYTLKADRFSSHAIIANLVQKQAKHLQVDPYYVFDVGCAYGFLRSYLPKPQFYLIGVEANKNAVEYTRQLYDEVYQADVSTHYQLPISQRPHSIIFGDVLEHLPDPLNSLKWTLQTYAAQDSQIIVSLPNIAHLYVRLNLLLGRFDYAERGIMDRTHLRFFTLRTAKEMLTLNGLQINSTTSTPVPLPLLNPLFSEGQPLFPLHLINKTLVNIFKQILAYQFVFEAYHAT